MLFRSPRRVGGAVENFSEDEFGKRLEYDYRFASNILKTTAQLTDAYFRYTPPQIMLAAHLLADEPVTMFYLRTKMPSEHAIFNKMLETIRSCAQLLASHRSFTSSSTPADEKEAREKKDKAEIGALMRKLKLCRDPDKIDLVKLNQAQKRDALRDGELEESKAKKRKLNREKGEKESDAFWGPELPKPS